MTVKSAGDKKWLWPPELPFASRGFVLISVERTNNDLGKGVVQISEPFCLKKTNGLPSRDSSDVLYFYWAHFLQGLFINDMTDIHCDTHIVFT